MRMLLAAMLVAALAATPAWAQTQAATWVQFVDPTEQAFALDVPQGWTVKGGIKRFSTVVATLWVTAASPDGAIQVFVGDPAITPFMIPKSGQAEGTALPPFSAVVPPAVTLSYRAGAEFAKFYGPKSLAGIGCTDAVPTGTQAMPDLARFQYERARFQSRGLNVRGGFTPPQHDAGLVAFTCQTTGRGYAAGVVADTAQPLQMGYWSVSVAAGYLAPQGQDAAAFAVLNHMLGTRQWNPQWDEAMHQAAQDVLNHMAQAADRDMALLQRNADQFSAMLKAQGDANMARLTANHNAYMAEQNRESAQRNAAFKDYEAARSLNSWNFTAHIRNGELYRNPNTGGIFEVDH
ncbi:MAG: hypothetical protein WDN69_13820 [Aliidongia sp.]